MADNEKSYIRPLLNKIYPCAAVMTVICFLITLIWGFKWQNLIGFAVGCGYMCLCYEYLGRVCCNAVRMDKKRAGSAMTRCYLIRLAGLFCLCAFGGFTGLINMSGVIIPQLFPRIILTVLQFSRKG